MLNNMWTSLGQVWGQFGVALGSCDIAPVIYYDAFDASGNRGSATRAVKVVEAVGDAAEEVLLTIHFIKRAS